MKREIVPATPELLEKFYGHAQARTVRALAALVDGEPLCVAGLYQDGSLTVAFADVSPKMRASHVLTGVKLARRVMDMIVASGVTVIAMADENVDCSARFLQSLGFVHIDNGVYAWLG